MRLASRARAAISALRLAPAASQRQAETEALLEFARDLERNGLRDSLSSDVEQWAPFLRFAPPGHYYSPIPRRDAIESDAARIWQARDELPGIDLRVAEQRKMVAQIAAAIGTDGFAEAPQPDRRYFTNNVSFGVGDATILHGMLRLYRPTRIVEIGSGHSSALILDVVEQHLPETSVTFVEPYPQLLRSLMRAGDEARCQLVEQRVQDVPIEVVQQLGPDDVLFIDSTHVVRTGSDVCRLVLDVLPALAPGVIVHVHDIFWPFEMLPEWVDDGRQWAECYLVRAFLTGNQDWEILLFNNYLARYEPDLLQRVLPQFLTNSGGSLWLRRVA